MDDFFPKMSMKPNPDCDEYHCKVLQKKFAEKEAERLKNQPNGKWRTQCGICRIMLPFRFYVKSSFGSFEN